MSENSHLFLLLMIGHHIPKSTRRRKIWHCPLSARMLNVCIGFHIEIETTKSTIWASRRLSRLDNGSFYLTFNLFMLVRADPQIQSSVGGAFGIHPYHDNRNLFWEIVNYKSLVVFSAFGVADKQPHANCSAAKLGGRYTVKNNIRHLH